MQESLTSNCTPCQPASTKSVARVPSSSPSDPTRDSPCLLSSYHSMRKSLTQMHSYIERISNLDRTTRSTSDKKEVIDECISERDNEMSEMVAPTDKKQEEQVVIGKKQVFNQHFSRNHKAKTVSPVRKIFKRKPQSVSDKKNMLCCLCLHDIQRYLPSKLMECHHRAHPKCYSEEKENKKCIHCTLDKKEDEKNKNDNKEE